MLTTLVGRMLLVQAAAPEHDRGRGDDVVVPVVLADAEDVEPEPVGELDLLEQIVHPLLRGDLPPGLRIRRQVAEGVDA
jgi:hypothetical protein